MPPKAFASLTPVQRYALIRAKIERAKQNLRDMEAGLAALHGYIPGAKRQIRSKLRPAGQIPTYDISFDTLCAAGDVVTNLASSLDHLLFQLVKAHSPRTTEKRLRLVYFPIAKDVSSYKDSRRRIKELINPDAVKLIDSLKPYKGGNYPLWLLHELNNASKHRLILNVCNIVICHADWVRDLTPDTNKFIYILGRPQFSGIYGRPEVKDYILTTGQEVLTRLRPGRREAILPVLHYLTAYIDGVVKSFLPYL